MSLDSTRMSNESGTGNIGRDKNAMAVAIEHSVILALIVVWAVAFGHDIWAGFFSNRHETIKKLASLTSFLAISITFHSVQGFLSDFCNCFTNF